MANIEGSNVLSKPHYKVKIYLKRKVHSWISRTKKCHAAGCIEGCGGTIMTYYVFVFKMELYYTNKIQDILKRNGSGSVHLRHKLYLHLCTTCIASFVNTIDFSSVFTYLRYFPDEKNLMQIFQNWNAETRGSFVRQRNREYDLPFYIYIRKTELLK